MTSSKRSAQKKILSTLWLAFVPGFPVVSVALGLFLRKTLHLSFSETAATALTVVAVVCLLGGLVYRHLAFSRLVEISDPDLRQVMQGREFLANIVPWIGGGIAATNGIVLASVNGDLVPLWILAPWLAVHLLLMRPRFAWG